MNDDTFALQAAFLEDKDGFRFKEFSRYMIRCVLQPSCGKCF